MNEPDIPSPTTPADCAVLAKECRNLVEVSQLSRFEPGPAIDSGNHQGLAAMIGALLVGLFAWTLPALPAPSTPGAIVSSDPASVCIRGYSRTVRPRYDYAWRKFRVSVFRAYGIPHEEWRNFTLDHDIPLSLGGAPEDLRNVWPEPKAEAKRKDEVEDALLAAACYRHTLTLTAAQAAIARNWTTTPVGLPAIRERRQDER